MSGIGVSSSANGGKETTVIVHVIHVLGESRAMRSVHCAHRSVKVDGPLPEYDQRLNIECQHQADPTAIHSSVTSLPVAGNHSYNCSRNFKFLFRLEIPTAVVAIFSMKNGLS